MAYIGNTPAENYASFLTETFTVSATTNYTLSHAVSNENDIRLVINGVVQQPGSGKSYTASNTTLTLTSATVSGDVMYAVYLGRALQTVNPPAASVGNSQTAPTIITGQTAETSIATDDTILIHDTSASALRKMTRANFVSGVGGVNTPAFFAYLSSDQNITSDTWTKLQCNTEEFDSDNNYNNSTNYRFTPTTAGKYYLFAQGFMNNSSIFVGISKNGTRIATTRKSATDADNGIAISVILTANGSSDYFEAEVFHQEGATIVTEASERRTHFGAYKIIE